MRVLAFILCLFATNAVAATPQQMAEELGRETDQMGMAAKTDDAISQILWTAILELRMTGHREEADKIKQEYEEKYMGFLTRMETSALGDHAPLSEWLARVCLELEALLGSRVFHVLHLDDLVTVNFAIPVVFHPHAAEQWCLETQEATCKIDYSMHFVPLSGVCAYWVAWGTCTGITWGMGAVTMICTPVGQLCRNIMQAYIAPPLSDKFWDRRNPAL